MAGCRTGLAPSAEAISLSCAASEPSKSEPLTAGEQVAVFACLEGTEHYFLEGEPFVVGADGHTLTYGSAVYYPDPKQAVRFCAYFPYHTGAFVVPTDQGTPAALKQADLCWATASSTPVATPVSLGFGHLLARLVVQTTPPAEKISVPNAVSGGVLHPSTGAFQLNSNKSEVFTTGNELILPAQPLTRLLLTIDGVEHPFTPAVPLDLPAGQTTTLHLTLNPTTNTLSLSGSSVTNWVSSATQGTPSHPVSNILTLHWPNYLQQGATPDKIVMTITNQTTNVTADYTVASGIGYANKTFTVPFASSALHYPYVVSKVAFYKGSTMLHPKVCTMLLGATIYKSAATTVGIKDIPNAILINGLWWATGNLIADGFNGCRIGVPTDCGLYFAFGSLVGWSGGAAPNYDGSGPFASNEALVKVWPVAMGSKPNLTWPIAVGSTTTLNQPYFSIFTTGYNADKYDISTYTGPPSTGIDLAKSTLRQGRYARLGVGDPCAYYLGGTWRVPNYTDLGQSFGGLIPKVGSNYWTKSGVYFYASGYRRTSENFSDIGVPHVAIHTSAAISTSWQNYQLYTSMGGSLEVLLVPHEYQSRNSGAVVRCVSEKP